ncbi:type II toxin-antitoxin system HicA family toxin [Actinomycetospora sp. C-140]
MSAVLLEGVSVTVANVRHVPVKVSEMIKLLEADGWYLVRVTGSHRQFRHPMKPGTATIAGKPSATLPRGTEKSILRQADIEGRSR